MKKVSLQQEWDKNKPRGHHLSWNGDTLGIIVCSRCSRKWQYAAGQVWRVQIQQKCSGTTEEEDLRREKLRTALREWQEQQAADPTPHELALNEETDLVCCGRCKRSAAARTWRANFSAACPGPGGQTEEERRREMKRGKVATARLTGNTGLFGVGEGARPPRQATRSGGTHKKPISKSASRKVAAAASGGSRPPAPAAKSKLQPPQASRQKTGRQPARGPADPKKPRGRSAPSAPD